MEHEKPTRRIRAGQPPADLELWEDDLNDMPEEPLSDAIAAVAVVIIMVIIGACAALIVGVI
jgi:hypothetical protein